MPPMYDPEAVRPMWEELANIGVQPLTTPEEVEQVMSETEGTTMVVVNSVCGCAAGNCRPGVALALQHDKIPDRMVTVFAGMDTEAVAKAREYFGFQPSSPNIVLFKDGQLAGALQRMHIEQMTAVDIANTLTNAFDEICTRQGPSVPPEVFDKNEHVDQCGSSIPLYKGN